MHVPRALLAPCSVTAPPNHHSQLQDTQVTDLELDTRGNELCQGRWDVHHHDDDGCGAPLPQTCWCWTSQYAKDAPVLPGSADGLSPWNKSHPSQLNHFVIQRNHQHFLQHKTHVCAQTQWKKPFFKSWGFSYLSSLVHGRLQHRWTC